MTGGGGRSMYICVCVLGLGGGDAESQEPPQAIPRSGVDFLDRVQNGFGSNTAARENAKHVLLAVGWTKSSQAKKKKKNTAPPKKTTERKKTIMKQFQRKSNQI